MQTYRLQSSEAIYAPNVVRMAINGAKFEADRPQMIKIICQGWNLPEDAATKLVMGEVPFTVEDETVVFTV